MRNFIFSSFVLFFFPFSAFASFSDVPETYIFYKSISFIENEGIVVGYPDNSFKPENEINRAEFIKILIEDNYSDSEISMCDFDTYNFPDMQKSDWFAPYVCLAKQEEIIEGYADGMFHGENKISLPEAMKIMIKIYNQEDEATSLYFSTFYQEKFTDDFSFHWGTQYIHYFVKNIDEKENNVKKRFFGAAQEVTEEFFNHRVTRGEITYLLNFFKSNIKSELYATGEISSISSELQCLSDIGCVSRDNYNSEDLRPFFTEVHIFTLKNIHIFSLDNQFLDEKNRKLVVQTSEPLFDKNQFHEGDRVRVKAKKNEITGILYIEYMEQFFSVYNLDEVKKNITEFSENYKISDVFLKKEMQVNEDRYIYTFALSRYSCREPLGFSCINYLVSDDENFQELEISGFPIKFYDNWIYFEDGSAGGGGVSSVVTAFNINTKEAYSQEYSFSDIENSGTVFVTYFQEFPLEKNKKNMKQEPTEKLKILFSHDFIKDAAFRKYMQEKVEKGSFSFQE